MTPRQIELARQALGLNEGCLVSRRNVAIVGQDTTDLVEWRAMEAAGFAVYRTVFNSQDAQVFRLTRAGAERALKPGDQLSAEDWPQQ